MKSKKFLLTFLISLIFISSYSFSQDIYDIDYYGVVSKEVDDNLYKMTSDLYFTQLSEINTFNVTDKRNVSKLENIPENSTLSKDNISFYAVIQKKQNTNIWIATLNIVDKKNNISKSNTREYDSYYKILMEPKTVLQEVLKGLITDSPVKNTEKISDKKNEEIPDKNISSTENLSGTWSGEKGISKIVIMRGGRGFVIFENGASMNILLNVSNNKIKITQSGKSNASFYPEIPRQLALTAAISSNPITWTFELTDNNTLSGIKNTLIMSGENVSEGQLNVTWIRQ